MKSKRILLIIGICYLLCSGILYRISTKVVDKRLSIVEINDIICTVENNTNMDKLEKLVDEKEEQSRKSEKETILDLENTQTKDRKGIESYHEEIYTKQDINNIKKTIKQYHHAICILDKNENILYQSSKKVSTTVMKAIELGDTVMNIEKAGRNLGYVLISNHTNTVEQKYKQIRFFVFTSGAFVIISLMFYAMYIDKRIIKPFEKLTVFAKDIAAGNLDAPLVMDRGNVFGAFTESFDIMREQLSIARENEKEANQSKKELVASLSHDIKTPLASIKALAEVLLVTMQDNTQLNKVHAIENKAIQIEELTNNLFHSTLEELQIIKVEHQEEESSILTDILYGVDYQHKINKIEIPECLIICDRLRLEQVFDNIIFNSYKYANTDITMQSRIFDNYLEIHFRDYGGGVDENEVPLLMQKYYRGSNAKGKNGAGIGLYMSQYFMKKMHGMITVNNTLDGFEVSVYISLVGNQAIKE